MPYKNPHPLYYVWAKIRYRARKSGTHVCQEWDDFSRFLSDVGERPSEGMLLIRRDDSLGYTAANCVWVEESGKRKIKAGYVASISQPLYTVWRSMISRCCEPGNRHYKNYGGRGISICDRWRHDFHAFVSDMGDRPAGYSIERKDNDGNYEPGNCKWATKKEQQSNRRVNRLITFNGETKTVTAWAQAIGVKQDTILERLLAGHPPEIALTMKRLPKELRAKPVYTRKPGRPAAKSPTCAYGHEYNEKNTYIGSHGYRSCRECHRLREIARRAGV